MHIFSVLLHRKVSISFRCFWASCIRLVFNASPFECVPDSLPLDKVDIFCLNEHEAKVLARAEADVESALLRQYPTAMFVITYGARGAAVIAQTKQRLWMEALKVRVIDTTGAGDMFLGYFVSRMAKGSTDEECLRYASQAAALCLQRRGARHSAIGRRRARAGGQGNVKRILGMNALSLTSGLVLCSEASNHFCGRPNGTVQFVQHRQDLIQCGLNDKKVKSATGVLSGSSLR